MIIALDHLIFGNGFGMKSPHCDDVFYWLGGEMYQRAGWFGCQLRSFQWKHPKPGECRKLLGREFVVFHSNRRWLRVEVSWAMTRLPHDIDKANEAIRALKAELASL